MYYDLKIGIYKGIIRYLLNSTSYPLYRIATLSNSSVEHLQAIYCHNKLPKDSSVELNLLKLFMLFTDMEQKGELRAIANKYKPLES